jgi:hypothetical protein
MRFDVAPVSGMGIFGKTVFWQRIKKSGNLKTEGLGQALMRIPWRP